MRSVRSYRRGTSRVIARVAFTVGCVAASASASDLDRLRLDVVTGNEVYVLAPGKGEVLSLALRNAGRDGARVVVSATMEAFDGATTSLPQREIDIAAGARVTWPVAAPERAGVYWIDYLLTDRDTSTRKKGSTSFARFDPAGPTLGRAAGFQFGLCQGRTERAALVAALAGAKVIRNGLKWDARERRRGHWDWRQIDDFIAMYEKYDIEVQALLAYCPKWAAPEPHRSAAGKGWGLWNRQAPDLDAWRTFVRTSVRRYKGRIRMWEVWNEPDWGFYAGTIPQYLDMLGVAYEEIKAEDPRSLVMTGGFASADPRGGRPYNPALQEAVLRDGQDWFDIHAVHQHGTFDRFSRRIDELLIPCREKYLRSDKPMIWNETAMHFGEGRDAARRQAALLVKKLTFAWSRGAHGYYWFKVADMRREGKIEPWGLVTHDYHPKPALPTYANLVRLLRGKRYDSALTLEDERWGFVFGGDEEYVAVAWQEDETLADDLLVFDVGAGATVDAIDMMGNESRVETSDGLAVIALTERPVFLRVRGSDSPPRVAGALLSFDKPLVAAPGQSMDLTCTLWNPFARRERFAVSWSLPEEVSRETSSSHRHDLAAGARATDTSCVDVPAKASARYAERFEVRLRCVGDRSGLGGVITAPLSLAKLVPDGEWESREPDFVLSERGHVRNYYEHDPTQKRLMWKGPEDLSARVWLGRRPGALLLRVDVTDDVHHQRYKGQMAWKGDSLQVGIEVPGLDGHFEAGLSRWPQGGAHAHIFQWPRTLKNPWRDIRIEIAKRPGGMVYDAVFPYASFGLSDEILQSGIRFNLVVNDSDGSDREGWLRIAPGIAVRKDPSRFPLIVFER